jgi:hypothetical protein
MLTGEFENYIRKSGMECMAAEGSDPAQFVSNIQIIHEKFLTMIRDVLSDDPEFHSTLERVFSFFLIQH